MSRELPLVAGRLVGLRAWSIADDGTLRGRYEAHAWATGTATHARCRRGASHEAPGSRCGCGLYGLHPTREGTAMLADHGGPSTVLGLIEAWGIVEVHAAGFRAQYAQPVAVAIPPHAGAAQRRRIRRAAERHGVPLLPNADAAALARHCRERRLGLVEPTLARLLEETKPDIPREPQPLPRPRSRLQVVAGRALGALAAAGALFGAAHVVVRLDDLARWVDPPPPPRPAAERDLRVVAATVVDYDDGSGAYIAIVRNDHPTLTAIGVWARGPGLDGRRAQERRPALAPGQVALLVDELGMPPGRPPRVRLQARRFVAGATRPTVVVGPVVIDRRRCVATARVHSDRAREQLDVSLVFGTPRDEIVVAAEVPVGPIPRGTSRQVLQRVHPLVCVRRRYGMRGFAKIAPRELTRGAQRPT